MVLHENKGHYKYRAISWQLEGILLFKAFTNKPTGLKQFGTLVVKTLLSYQCVTIVGLDYLQVGFVDISCVTVVPFSRRSVSSKDNTLHLSLSVGPSN